MESYIDNKMRIQNSRGMFTASPLLETGGHKTGLWTVCVSFLFLRPRFGEWTYKESYMLL